MAPTPPVAQTAPVPFLPPANLQDNGQPTYLPLDQQMSQFQLANPQEFVKPPHFSAPEGHSLVPAPSTSFPSTLVNRTGASSTTAFPYPPHAPRSKARTDDVRREADQQAFMAEIERLFGTAGNAGFAEPSAGVDGYALTLQRQGPPDWMTAVDDWTTMPAPIGEPEAIDLVGGVHGLQVAGGGSTAAAPNNDEFDIWLQFQTPPATSISNPISPQLTSGPSDFEVALQGWIVSGMPAEALPDVVRDELLVTSVHWRRQAALIISYEALANALAGPEPTRPHPGLLWAMASSHRSPACC